MRDSFVIITDSTVDISPAYADSLGLVIIPYIFRIEDREYYNYLDHREFPSKAFYAALHEGKTASTSLVTEQRYTDTFEPFLKQGRDILYMCLSTGLSGSFGQCQVAAEALKKAYPERKLVIIDSLCASMGQGLLAYYASKARDEGKTINETETYVRGLIPKLCHWVTVNDLNHLRRGGRVSGASAFVGTMLNIKPIIHMDNEGQLKPVAKVRGRVNSMDYMIDRMEETLLEPKNQILFISHSDSAEDAQKLADRVINRLGPREIIINDIGPVIGAHTGPGTLTLFFLGSKR